MIRRIYPLISESELTWNWTVRAALKPKLDEDLKTVIAGADLPNDLMSRDQMEISQRLGPRAHNAFDTVLIYAHLSFGMSYQYPSLPLLSVSQNVILTAYFHNRS